MKQIELLEEGKTDLDMVEKEMKRIYADRNSYQVKGPLS